MIPFAATLAALAPVFLLILFGHLMKRGGFPGDGFWIPAERLTYYVLFPALLVGNLARAPLADVSLGPFALALVASWSAVALALLLLGRWLTMDGPGFTSVVQGGIRFNTYVGLAAAEALFGTAGLTLAAVVIAVLVPLVNVLCVGVLNRHGSAGMPGWGAVLRGLASNPLILACLLGILLNASAVGLPWGSGEVLDIIARAALPLGLFIVVTGVSGSGKRSSWWACRWWRSRSRGRWACRRRSAPSRCCSRRCRPPPRPTSWPARWAATRSWWPAC